MSTSIHYYPCYQETPKNHDLVIHEFLSGMNLFLTLFTILLSYGMFSLFIGIDIKNDRILRLQQRRNYEVIEGDSDNDVSDDGGDYRDENEDDDKDGVVNENEEGEDDNLSVSDTTEGEDDNDKGISVSEQADITYFS